MFFDAGANGLPSALGGPPPATCLRDQGNQPGPVGDDRARAPHEPCELPPKRRWPPGLAPGRVAYSVADPPKEMPESPAPWHAAVRFATVSEVLSVIEPVVVGKDCVTVTVGYET